MELPLVSILITSFNRANYIQAAIESALQQTYPHFEIIIVDNCSTDGTKEILEEYRGHEKVRIYLNDTNIGQFPNRNKAAQLAKGKYLKYLDSDDLLYPYSLDVMVRAMEQLPVAGLGICYEIKNGSPLSFPFELKPENSIRLHFEKGLLFPGPGSIIYKRTVFEEFNGFEDYGLPSDNFLTLKIASRYKVAALPCDLYWWRRHEMQEFNHMSENTVVQIQYYQINKQILEAKECPVSKTEAQYFLLCHKSRLCRWVIKYLLKGEFAKGGYILRNSDISLKDFLISLLPVRFFK